MDVPGEAAVADERVHVRAGPGAVAAERVVAGQRAVDDDAGRVAHGHHAAQVVGVGVVQGVAATADLHPHAHHLPGNRIRRPLRHHPTVGHFALVVRERRVDQGVVRPAGQDALPVGVVGERRRLARADPWQGRPLRLGRAGGLFVLRPGLQAASPQPARRDERLAVYAPSSG